VLPLLWRRFAQLRRAPVRGTIQALAGGVVTCLGNVAYYAAVVIGGGLGLSEGPYWDNLVASIRRHIWSETHRGLPVFRAATGADAGWLGAAATAARAIAISTNNRLTHTT
jgi:hypothetical protein